MSKKVGRSNRRKAAKEPKIAYHLTCTYCGDEHIVGDWIFYNESWTRICRHCGASYGVVIEIVEKPDESWW